MNKSILPGTYVLLFGLSIQNTLNAGISAPRSFSVANAQKFVELEKKVNPDERFLLEILVISPIERIIICNEGLDPVKYHEFTDLKQGDTIKINLNRSFRAYSSAVENLIFRVNYGKEKCVRAEGPGKFYYLHKDSTKNPRKAENTIKRKKAQKSINKKHKKS